MRNPHYDMIVEWAATGKQVQVLLNGEDWKDVNSPVWSPKLRYRFKPTVKFRNFRIQRDGFPVIRVTYEPKNQARIEKYKGFAGWLGDWQEVVV